VEAAYAWLVPWQALSDARFLSHLLQENVTVRYAQDPFQINGQQYDRGTLVITRADNRDMGMALDYYE